MAQCPAVTYGAKSPPTTSGLGTQTVPYVGSSTHVPWGSSAGLKSVSAEGSVSANSSSVAGSSGGGATGAGGGYSTRSYSAVVPQPASPSVATTASATSVRGRATATLQRVFGEGTFPMHRRMRPLTSLG